jgi:hypothetical protein
VIEFSTSRYYREAIVSECLAGVVVRVVDELSRAVFGPAGYSKETISDDRTSDVVLKHYRRHGAR